MSRKRKLVSLLTAVIYLLILLTPIVDKVFAAGGGIISFSPTHNSVDVSTVTNLEITFDSTPTPVAGKYIYIRKLSDNSLVETIEATSAAVTVNGNVATIDPASELAQNTGYYIEMSTGAFLENSVQVAGWTGSGTWAFTTVEWLTISTDNIAKRLAAGKNHIVGVRADGTVVAWGKNNYGQITVPVGLDDARAVAAGLNFSVAAKADGTVVAWGDSASSKTAVPAGITDAVKVDAFGTQGAALQSNGTAYNWGDGSNPNLKDYPANSFIDLAVGGWQSYALAPNGTILAWGGVGYDAEFEYVNYNVAGNIIAVDAGFLHSMILKSDGTITTWGSNTYNLTSDTPTGSNFTAISAGLYHSVALKDDGTVVAWGYNLYNQCAVSTWTDVIAIVAGELFTLGIKSDGTLLYAGGNLTGEGTIPVGFTVFDDSGAKLSALTTSEGAISPAFDSDTMDYYIEVIDSTTSITVTPTVESAGATVKVNGTSVSSGTPSGSIAISPGSNMITIQVTDANSIATKNYSIEVRSINGDVTLSDITIDGVTIDGFDPSILEYYIDLPYDTVVGEDGIITVEGTATNGSATVTGDGNIVFTLGQHDMTINVTLGLASQDYVLHITRQSNDATLTGILLDGIPIPAFATDDFSYDVNVPFSATSPSITYTKSNSGATVVVTGGTGLSLGNNVITLEVTSEDGSQSETYTVNAYRQNNVATLSDLTVDGITIPAFAYSTYEYYYEVPNSTTSVTIGATATDLNASIDGTGSVVLDEGVNPVDITVTSEDGTEELIYSITIRRISTDATLSDLLIDSVTIPGFDPEVTSYLYTVGGDVASVTIDAVATDDGGAQITGTGVKTLALGDNVYNIVVTADDDTTQITYTVTVRRGDTVSRLTDLQVDGVTVSGFDPNITGYIILVPTTTTEVDISATTEDAGATVSGTGTDLAIAVGDNIFNIVVTAEDLVTQTTYVLTVHRVSTDATLSDILIDGVSLPGFDPAIIIYDLYLEIGNNGNDVIIVGVKNQENAVVTGDGTFNFPVGTSIVQIDVTAEDGVTTKSYIINVHRDETPPEVQSFDPANDEIDVAVSGGISITFDEDVSAASGKYITIRKKSNDEVFEIIEASSSQVTIDGNVVTIMPSNIFASSTNYYVEIETGAFGDYSANKVVGWTGSDTWEFTTYAIEWQEFTQFETDYNNTDPGDFKGPWGQTFDPSGNLWVVDRNNNRLQKYNGKEWTVYGQLGSAAGQFSTPIGVVADSAGNIYVTDFGNNRVQKFDGTTWTVIASPGTQAGQVTGPWGVAIDSHDYLWISEFSGERVQRLSGVTWTVFGHSGTGAGEFTTPTGIAIDSQDNVWVVEYGADRLQKYNGSVWTIYGQEGTDPGEFMGPRSIAIDQSDNIWVSEYDGNRLSMYNGEVWTKFGSDFGENIPQLGQFSGPSGITFDGLGNIYIAEYKDNSPLYDFRIQVGVLNNLPPEVAELSPLDGFGNFPVSEDLSIKFEETVSPGTGYFHIYKSDDTLIESFDVTTDLIFSGNTVTFTPSTDLDSLTEYYVLADSGCLVSLLGEPWVGISDKTAWNFTTSNGSAMPEAPIVTIIPTVLNIANIDEFQFSIDSYEAYGTYSYTISSSGGGTELTGEGSLNADGDVVIIGVDVNDLLDGDITVSATVSTMFAVGPSAEGTDVVIKDTAEPTVDIKSPYDGELISFLTDTISVTFNENIVFNTGNIRLYSEDNILIESFDAVTNLTVENNVVTMNLTDALVLGTNYYVVIDEGTINDANGNSFEGFAAQTGWYFSAVSDIVMLKTFPADNEITASNTGNLIMVFDVPVSIGTGDIRIRRDNDNSIISSTAGSGSTLLNVSVDNNKIILDPATDFEDGTQYYVEVDEDAIMSGTYYYKGVTGKDTWDFRTVTWALLAGSETGTSGSGYGELNYPTGALYDDEGNLWVTDRLNYRIAKFDGSSWTYITTYQIGGGDVNTFGYLTAIAYYNSTIYVTDNTNKYLIALSSITGEGIVRKLINGGTAEVNEIIKTPDNTLLVADFASDSIFEYDMNLSSETILTSHPSDPFGMAIEPITGNIYVANTGTGMLDYYSSTGTYLGTIANPPSLMRDMAFDIDGNLWVSDLTTNAIYKYYMDDDIWIKYGTADVTGALGEFLTPRTIFFNDDNILSVVDRNNHRIQSVVTSDLLPHVIHRSPADNEATASYDGDMYIIFEEDIQRGNGDIEVRLKSNGSIVATTADSSITVVITDNIARLTLTSELAIGTEYYINMDGYSFVSQLSLLPTAAITNTTEWNFRTIKWFNYAGNESGVAGSGVGQLSSPTKSIFDENGKLWIADKDNDRIQTYDGISYEIIGTPDTGSHLAGELDNPYGIFLDNIGNLFVTESVNDRIQEYNIAMNSWTIIEDRVTLGIDSPKDYFIASDGYIWLTDGAGDRVLRSDGNTWTVMATAGTGVGEFDNPIGIAEDSSGNIYIADSLNNRIQVYDGSSWQVIGEFGSEPGQFYMPYSMAFDGNGDLWVADGANNRLQRYDGYVWITYGTDASLDINKFNCPISMVFDEFGNLYVTENGANRVKTWASIPQITHLTPANEEDLASNTGELTIIYDREIVRSTGAISIKLMSNGSVVKTTANGTLGVTVEDNIATLSHTGLQPGTQYYVEIEQGAFTASGATTPSSAILGTDFWNFETIEWNWYAGSYPPGFGTDLVEFYEPYDFEIDANDYIWVADRYNDVVKKFNGIFWATYGEPDLGDAEAGQLKDPYGITFDDNGDFWITDSLGSKIYRYDISENTWHIEATSANVNIPMKIFFNSNGDIWVSEYETDIIKVYNGSSWSTLGVQGSGGPGEFLDPTSMTQAPNGDIWVTDRGNNRLQVYDGSSWTIFGGAGTEPGQFSEPYDIEFDENGDMWVSDSGLDRLQRYDGQVWTIYGGVINGIEIGQFNRPVEIEFDSNNNIFILENTNARIQASIPNQQVPQIQTSAPRNNEEFASNTGKLTAMFNMKVVRGTGDIVVRNALNDSIVYTTADSSLEVAIDGRKVTFTHAGFEEGAGYYVEMPVGAFQGAYTGTPSLAVSGSGQWSFTTIDWQLFAGYDPPASGTGSGEFNTPQDIEFDNNGNMWVVDRLNHRIQKYDGNTWTAYGIYGLAGVPGQLNEPVALGIDSSGNVWVADNGNNQVQKYDVSYSVWTIEANASDGFNGPTDILIDRNGDIWVPSYNNDKVFVLSGGIWNEEMSSGSGAGQVDGPTAMAEAPNGYIWLVENTLDRLQVYNGYTWEIVSEFGSEPGQLNNANRIVFDMYGDLWVSEAGNNRLQRFDGYAWTVYADEYIDGETIGEFNIPHGLAFDAKGNFFVSDSVNHRIQAGISSTGDLNAIHFAPEDGEMKASKDGEITIVFDQWISRGVGDISIKKMSDDLTVYSTTLANLTVTIQSTSVRLSHAGLEEGTEYYIEMAQGALVSQLSGDQSDAILGRSQWNFATIDWRYFAGKLPTPSTGTGLGEFDHPIGIEFDEKGNLWIVDRLNDRLQMYDGAEWIGYGSYGTTNPGELDSPNRVAVDSEGNLWVSDLPNSRIQKYDIINGVWTVELDTTDGLVNPNGLDFDANGNLWITDMVTNGIYMYDGVTLHTIATSGINNFVKPAGINVMANGEIWVADFANNRVQKYVNGQWYLLAPSGTEHGEFAGPISIAQGTDGDAWVSDFSDERIQRFDGVVWTEYAMQTGTAEGQFNKVSELFVDENGVVWAADYNNSRIQVGVPYDILAPTLVSTAPRDDDEMASSIGDITLVFDQWMEVGNATNVAIREYDSGDLVYSVGNADITITIGSHNRIILSHPGLIEGEQYYLDIPDGAFVSQISNKAFGGTIDKDTVNFTVIEWNHFMGNVSGAPGTGDGELNNPKGMAFDSEGNLWYADKNNDRIQKYNGSIWETYGTPGAAGTPGYLDGPQAIALQDDQNIWVAEDTNNQVQKYNTTNLEWSIEGNAADGIDGVKGLVFDANGDLWVTSSNNNKIMKYNGTTWTTVATVGSGIGEFLQPAGIVSDAEGNIWVADYGNNRIQIYDGSEWSVLGEYADGSGLVIQPYGLKFDSNGDLWVSEFSDDILLRYDGYCFTVYADVENGTALGEFNGPSNIEFDNLGNVFATDSLNNRIQASTKNFVHIELISTAPRDDEKIASDVGALTMVFDQWVERGSGDILIKEEDGTVVYSTADPLNLITIEFDGNLVRLFHDGLTEGTSYYIEMPEGAFVSVLSGGRCEALIGPDAWNFSTIDWFLYAGRENGIGGGVPGQFRRPHDLEYDDEDDMWVSDFNNDRIHKYNGEQWIQYGVSGTGDNQLDGPRGLDIGPDGYLWIADYFNKCIKKMNTDTGEVTLAIASPVGGFINPTDILFDSRGNLWVTDYWGYKIYRHDGVDWQYYDLPELATPDRPRLTPYGIAEGPDGTIWIADSWYDRLLWYDYDTDTFESTEWPINSTEIGEANGCSKVAFDDNGDMWVSEYDGNRIQRFDGNCWTIYANVIPEGQGSPIGVFYPPLDMAFKDGVLFVTDYLNNRIQAGMEGTGLVPIVEHKTPADNEGLASNTGDLTLVYDQLVERGAEDIVIRKKSDNSIVYTTANGSLTVVAKLKRVIISHNGLEEGTEYYVEMPTGAIRSKYTLGLSNAIMGSTAWNFTTVDWYHFAGALPTPTSGTGGGEFNAPRAITIGLDGSIWVADGDNGRVQRYDGTDWINYGTYSATPTNPGEFARAVGVAFDDVGDLWVTDALANNVQRYDIDLNTWYIMGDSTDGINNPQNIDFDSNGDAWLSCYAGQSVFKYSGGTWTQMAGYGTGLGEFIYPQGLIVDDEDVVWITDAGAHKIQMYDIDAGTWTQMGSMGTSAGQFITVKGLKADANGDIWVAEYGNERLQRYDGWTWTTYSGLTASTQIGEFTDPDGLAFDKYNNIYVAEIANNRIQSGLNGNNSDLVITSTSPLDNTETASYNANLVLTYNHWVERGTGDISIWEDIGDDGNTANDIQVFSTTNGDESVSNGIGVSFSQGSVIFNPGANFIDTTTYYVHIDAGAFAAQTYGMTSAAVSDNTTWNFAVYDWFSPYITGLGPVPGATDVSLNTNLTIIFNENITKVTGAGKEIIISDGGSYVETVPLNSNEVTISRNVVTVNLDNYLQSNSLLYVTIDAGSFVDDNKNEFAGLLDTETWTFSTPYNDADLSSLYVDDNVDPESNLVLEPFSPDTLNYTVLVSLGVYSVDVTPILSDSNATISNFYAIDKDSNTLPVVNNGGVYTVGDLTYPLSNGLNTLSITVRAEDEMTYKTYSITVIRDIPLNLIVGNMSFNYSTNMIDGINDIWIDGEQRVTVEDYSLATIGWDLSVSFSEYFTLVPNTIDDPSLPGTNYIGLQVPALSWLADAYITQSTLPEEAPDGTDIPVNLTELIPQLGLYTTQVTSLENGSAKGSYIYDLFYDITIPPFLPGNTIITAGDNGSRFDGNPGDEGDDTMTAQDEDKIQVFEGDYEMTITYSASRNPYS